MIPKPIVASCCLMTVIALWSIGATVANYAYGIHYLWAYAVMSAMYCFCAVAMWRMALTWRDSA